MKVIQKPPTTSAVDSILALDVATMTGWAYVGLDGSVQFGSIDFGAGVERFVKAQRWFGFMLDRHQPALVASEEPCGSRNAHVNKVLYGLWAILRVEAAKRRIAIYPVDNNVWKKALTGQAKVKPDDYAAFVRKLGYRVRNPDEAAALGILWHVDALIP